MTHPTELRFLEIAKRCTAVGIQAAQAYNNEQAALHLERVLSQGRLYTKEGTCESLSILARLRELTESHKQAYAKYVATVSGELIAAIQEMPAPLQEGHRNRLVSSINWQLNAQAEFYANRERWIDAAERICHLIESRRATCVFSDAGISFEGDADLLEFSAFLAVIEETHQAEVAAMRERLHRLAISLSILGGSNAK